ncbi:hypothetical protein MCOR25_007325 [Pyricularia grisea]|uniref:Mid2 domain-containing protein n=1 Tax=Pyricularia grisea TaxID=148305 RepID=A0A6P8BBB3_PYRGI|nr:uncharacterized protein PgNI_03883 [Pyricularia grisea]KAI6358450.1 hypothetical protein MCOR25_007325 [Pyricularia grisea]TLD13131.1 hypothetical protein PgNI_03883 [Pyricularia grisea]
MARIGSHPILGLVFGILLCPAAIVGLSSSSHSSTQNAAFLEQAAAAAPPPCDDKDHWMGLGVVQPSIPGTPAFTLNITGNQNQIQLSRRDCLSNGTNFCFGNNVNYCGGCGVCCADSANKWCCGADGICCGKSCCGKGQSCRQGQCIGHPSKTTTIVSTVHTTLTRIVTKIDTVIIAVISTSFVDTVVTLTESKPGATYTDIVYVTTTVLAEGSEPTPPSNQLRDASQEDDASSSNASRLSPGSLASPGGQKLDNSPAKAQTVVAPAVARRQEQSRPPATSVLFSTVTTMSIITELDEVVSTISSTTTISSISVVVAEVPRTRTQEVDAITTIVTTETQTITSRPAVTTTLILPGSNPSSSVPPPVIITTTAAPPTQTSLVPPDPAPTQNQGNSGNRGPPLSTAAIAGIAAGSAGFAALVAIAIYVFFLLRARRARKLQEWEDHLTGLSIPRVVYGGEIRQPRLPNMGQPVTQARFAPAVFAATHHERGSPRRQSAFLSTSSTDRSINSNGGLARAATFAGKPSHRSSETTSIHTVIPNVAELGDTSRVEMSGGEGWPMRTEVDHGPTDPMSSSPPGAMLAPSPMSPDIMDTPLALPPRVRRYSNYRDY